MVVALSKLKNSTDSDYNEFLDFLLGRIYLGTAIRKIRFSEGSQTFAEFEQNKMRLISAWLGVKHKLTKDQHDKFLDYLKSNYSEFNRLELRASFIGHAFVDIKSLVQKELNADRIIKTITEESLEMMKKDLAMVANDKHPKASSLEDPIGGIDMNSANLELQVKRDGKGVPLPLAQQDLAALAGITGFIPTIITIQPVTALPVFIQPEAK